MAFDASGNLWVADAASNRVVRFSPPFQNDMDANLVVGQANFTESGPSTAQNGMSAPYGVAFDPSGDLWVADAGNSRILEFKPPFSIGEAASLVIGQSNFTTKAHSTTATGLWVPTAIAFDSSGKLWVADWVNSRVLRFSSPFSTGMAASLVIGQRDFTSDLFATTQSGLSAPSGLAFDNAGSLWVSDSGNDRVLEFISPFANGMNASLVIGQSSFTGSAPTCVATRSAVCSPAGVSFDAWGNLWATDPQDNRVLEFSPPFSTGMSASSVLGQPDFTSSAASTSATGLSLVTTTISMANIAFDQSGNLWIGDTGNNRVLELTPRNNPVSTVPEFPPFLGTSAAALTFLVVLAMVGRVLFTFQRRRPSQALAPQSRHHRRMGASGF